MSDFTLCAACSAKAVAALCDEFGLTPPSQFSHLKRGKPFTADLVDTSAPRPRRKPKARKAAL